VGYRRWGDGEHSLVLLSEHGEGDDQAMGELRGWA